MLSIGKLVPGQADYYEKSVAQGRDDYYSGKGEAPGTWVGRGARALGLHGRRVEAARFNAMIAGIDPSDPELRRSLLTRERTVRVINGKRHVPTAAYDLTFSAPKSVSVLFATTDAGTARELVAAHDAAVRAALDYVEEHAGYTRRGRDGRIFERSEGLIAAAYRHRMSRANDPQLHTHVVVGNLVRTPSDGKWRTWHAALAYRHARTAGILYQSHLRAEVRDRLGLRWRTVVKGAAEIDGIPKAVLREFSTRRRMIEEAAREDPTVGLDTKARAESAALKTRQRKDQQVRTRDWRLEIIARAQEHGLDQAAIHQLLGEGRDGLAAANEHPDVTGDRGPSSEPHATLEPANPEDFSDRLAGPHGLTERQNTFGLRDLVGEIAEQHQHGIRVSAATADATSFLDRTDVLDVRPGEIGGLPEPRWTTSDLVASEQRLVDAAVQRRNADTAIVARAAVDRALAIAERPPTAEQEHVIRTITGSGNGMDVIEALAGTGKTFTAGLIRQVYEHAGIPVLGVAPTGRAARELSEVGIPARTLHATMASLDRDPEHALPIGAVVLLDEASMAPTRLTEQFLHAAWDADAKVIAIGDSGQLPSVQAGGWLRQIGQQVGAPRLTEVQRQRDPTERRMLGLLHDGNGRGADAYLEWLDGRARLEIDTDGAALIARALSDWAAAVREHGIDQAVLISRDQETRGVLNAAARASYADLGALGDERVYGATTIAVGDRVIARRNDYGIDVDNGTRGTVTAVHAAGVEIRTDGGAQRALPAAYVAEHVEHAYALTGHGMQGATVEWAGVVARPEHLTRGWAYTALSRAREETRLYVPAVDYVRRQERADIAPHDAVETPERYETIRKIGLRMRERDDEDLAVSQLIERQPRAGGPADEYLDYAQRSSPSECDIPQELAAQRAEPAVPPDDRAELLRLTHQLHQLERERGPALLREVRWLDELAAERQRTSEQRDRAIARLDALPGPTPRRFKKALDQHATERVKLSATIRAAGQRLSQIDSDETALRINLGAHPDQVVAEHRDRETTIRHLRRQRAELLDRIAEHLAARPPKWLTDRFGPRPSEPRAFERWNDSIRAAFDSPFEGDRADAIDAASASLGDHDDRQIPARDLNDM